MMRASACRGRDRIVHLDDIEIALIDPLGEGLEIGQFVVRHPEVADAAFLLPSAHQRHHDVDIDKAVAQHQVDFVAPQALAGEPQAVFALPVVAEILARGPDLVADEYLVIDVELGGELPDVHFSPFRRGARCRIPGHRPPRTGG